MSLIIRPGAPPPPITPYCQRCDQPVERYQLDLVKGGLEDVVGIHAQCCGCTSSTRIKMSVVLQLMRDQGAKLYVIVKKGSTAQVRERKRSDFSGFHG